LLLRLNLFAEVAVSRRTQKDCQPDHRFHAERCGGAVPPRLRRPRTADVLPVRAAASPPANFAAYYRVCPGHGRASRFGRSRDRVGSGPITPGCGPEKRVQPGCLQPGTRTATAIERAYGPLDAEPWQSGNSGRGGKRDRAVASPPLRTEPLEVAERVLRAFTGGRGQRRGSGE